MVTSSAFNVSMFIWSLLVGVPLFISRRAASPPVMLYLVPFLGQCGLWCSVNCRNCRCRILLFVLRSYLDHEFLYPACLGVLSSPFPTISRRFVIWAHVGDDIVDFSGLSIALATLDALCWIMSVMVLTMVSMSSSSCNVS